MEKYSIITKVLSFHYYRLLSCVFYSVTLTATKPIIPILTFDPYPISQSIHSLLSYSS